MDQILQKQFYVFSRVLDNFDEFLKLQKCDIFAYYALYSIAFLYVSCSLHCLLLIFCAVMSTM